MLDVLIAALIYALVDILVICGLAWLLVYILGVVGLPEPPARAVVMVIWLIAGITCLLVLARVVLPALGPLS
jgi:hypothetical protein